jgi:predicted MFS family arabinose efflux permease
VALLRYAIAAGLIRIADGCVGVAVVLLALQRTHSPGAAGVVVAGYTLPALVSGPLLGAWLDRTQYRKLALAGNELVLAGSMVGLVLTLGRAPLPWCLAIVAAAGVTLPLTSAGFTSLIPSLVPADQLPRVNTLDAVSFNGSAILGPAVAGTLAAATSPALAVLTTAAIAMAALPATLLLPTPRWSGRAAAASLWATVRAGTRVMVRTPPLRAGTITTVIALGAQGMFALGFPLFALRLGSRAEAGGALWGALEAGGLVGAFAATRILARYTPERVIIYGTALLGLAIACWPLARSIAAAVVLVSLAGLLSGPLLVATFSMRQRYTPGNLLAQVSTAGASLKIGAYAVGAAAGGWLIPGIGVRSALLVIAALHLAAAFAGYLAGQDRTGQDRTGPDRTGPDRSGPDRSGPDRTGSDRTGSDRAGLQPDWG